MPEKCSHKTETIRFRVATEDRAAMEAAAKDAGLTLSDWMRRTLLMAAAGKPEMVKIEPPKLSSGELVQGKTIELHNTGRVDPHKIAQFQRAAGMGGVKSRG